MRPQLMESLSILATIVLVPATALESSARLPPPSRASADDEVEPAELLPRGQAKGRRGGGAVAAW